MNKSVGEKAKENYRQHGQQIDRIADAQQALYVPSKAYVAAFARELSLATSLEDRDVTDTVEAKALNIAIDGLREAHLFHAAANRDAERHYKENMDEYNLLAIEEYKQTSKAIRSDNRLTFGDSTPEKQALIHDPSYAGYEDLFDWATDTNYIHPEASKVRGDSSGGLSAWGAIHKLYESVGTIEKEDESSESISLLTLQDGTELEAYRTVPRPYRRYKNRVFDVGCINVHTLAKALEEFEKLPEKPAFFSSTRGRVGIEFLQAFTEHRLQSLEAESAK